MVGGEPRRVGADRRGERAAEIAPISRHELGGLRRGGDDLARGDRLEELGDVGTLGVARRAVVLEQIHDVRGGVVAHREHRAAGERELAERGAAELRHLGPIGAGEMAGPLAEPARHDQPDEERREDQRHRAV